MDYFGEKDAMNAPKLLDGEQIYLWQAEVVWSEKRGDLKFGIVLITSYHLFWYSDKDKSMPVYKIPLFYVKDIDTSGGWLKNSALHIYLANTNSHPPYAKKLYIEIMKTPIPPLPSYPNEIRLEFTSKESSKECEKFVKELRKPLMAKHWLNIGVAKEELKTVSNLSKGIAGIEESIKKQTQQMSEVINKSFNDLSSLKESAKKLVFFSHSKISKKLSIADKIKSKLQTPDSSVISPEMQELQAVMYDVGIGTPVTKEAAGKEYYSQLAKQLAVFVKVFSQLCKICRMY